MDLVASSQEEVASDDERNTVRPPMQACSDHPAAPRSIADFYPSLPDYRLYRLLICALTVSIQKNKVRGAISAPEVFCPCHDSAWCGVYYPIHSVENATIPFLTLLLDVLHSTFSTRHEDVHAGHGDVCNTRMNTCST